MTSCTVTGVTTSSATTLIVVTIGGANFTGIDWDPPTVAWSAGTGCATAFTSRVSKAASFQAHHTSIWTAACTSTASARSIVVTFPSSATDTAVAIEVDALVGSPTVGVSNTKGWESTTTGANLTINGITANSWIYVAAAGEPDGALTPVTNTNEQQETLRGGATYAVVGDNTTGTAGNINVGWSTTKSFGQMSALEILDEGGAPACSDHSMMGFSGCF